MHDAIFEHQRDSRDALDEAHLVRYAADSGAEPAQVKLDLENGTFEEKVGGLHERHPQWRQRDADVLHQWAAIRGRLDRLSVVRCGAG